jgi:hypothetical protein
MRVRGVTLPLPDDLLGCRAIFGAGGLFDRADAVDAGEAVPQLRI